MHARAAADARVGGRARRRLRAAAAAPAEQVVQLAVEVAPELVEVGRALVAAAGPRFPPPRPQFGSFSDIDRCSVLEKDFGNGRAALRSCAASAIAPRNPASPAPVRALTRTREILPYSSRSTPGSRPAEIDLVPDRAAAESPSAPISASTLLTSSASRARAGRGAVHHVQQQVGAHRFLQRGAERRHQAVRQVADEADRVRDHHLPGALAPRPCASWCPAWRTACPRRRRRRSGASAR